VVSPQAEALTNQIREATNIIELVGEHVALKAAGSNHKGLCPFHNEKTPSFHVSPSKQIFKCFGCGAGGDVFKFVQLREGVSFSEARTMLAERAGIRLDARRPASSDGPDRRQLARVNNWAAEYFRKRLTESTAGELARQYLQQRQITPETAERFGLGYADDRWDGLLSTAAGQSISVKLLLAAGLVRARGEGGGHYDAFRHRLMFPIRDASDRVIGFGGRALGDDPAKYINSAETALFEKGQNLYGLDQARQAIAEQGHAILVEGYTDCLMAHQHGLRHVVATLGTALTERQVQVLRRFAERVTVVFDSDEAGQRAADRAIELFLTQQLAVRLARVPEGKDPCDFLLTQGREGFEALLGEATDALEHRWRVVAAACRADETPAGQLRAVDEFLRTVATSEAFGAVDAIRQGLLLNRMGKLLGMSGEQLRGRLASARRAAARSRRSGRVAESVPVAAPPSVRERAIRDMVEVLLNDPSEYEQVAAYLNAEQVEDPRLAAIVEELRTCGGATVALAAFVGRFEDPEYGQLITDLQIAGQRRGNYAETIEGALRRLAHIELRRELKDAGQAIRRAGESDGVEEQWSSLVDKARTHRHVLPPKIIGGQVDTGSEKRRAAGGTELPDGRR